MTKKLTQDDVSKLYADIYNQMKEGVAEAAQLGKQARFELADCSRESNINNILLNLCAVDAAKRLGVVADEEDNKDLSILAKELKKPEKLDFHVITIPCPVLIKKDFQSEDRYKNLDTASMVKVAAEVYQIANAEKSKGQTRVQKHALNFQPQSQSILLKP
jgi:hypothetical protein